MCVCELFFSFVGSYLFLLFVRFFLCSSNERFLCECVCLLGQAEQSGEFAHHKTSKKKSERELDCSVLCERALEN